MVGEIFRSWMDNPIFVKHVRSRLRVQPTASAIVVVQALCLCIAWAGFQLGTFSTGSRPYALLFLLQVIIIVGIGGAGGHGGGREPGFGDPRFPPGFAPVA